MARNVTPEKELPEFDRQDARQPFTVFLIVLSDRTRATMKHWFREKRIPVRAFADLPGFVSRKRDHGPGIVFADMLPDGVALSEYLSATKSELPVCFIGVKPATSCFAIRALLENRAVEFLSDAMHLPYDAVQVARRAYCRRYGRDSDWNLIAADGERVGLTPFDLLPIENLPPRSMEVLSAVAKGFDAEQIAAECGVPKSQVNARRFMAMKKVQARSLGEMMRLFMAWRALRRR